MNDYRLMWTESGSNKAPQDEQGDWLAGRGRQALLAEFPFQSWAASREAPSPRAWMGGVKPPLCQWRLASSRTAWCFCIVHLYRTCEEFACSTGSILHFAVSLSLPLPVSLCKHLGIFKHNVITPTLSTMLHKEVGSLSKLYFHFLIDAIKREK